MTTVAGPDLVSNVRPLVLYDNGNESTAITGGFTGKFTTCNIPSYYGVYDIGTRAAGYLEIDIPSGQASRYMESLVAPNLINLMDYTTLYADLEILAQGSSGNRINIGFWTSTSNGDSWLANARYETATTTLSRQVISQDISAANNTGYPAILATNATNAGTAIKFRVYKMWMV